MAEDRIERRLAAIVAADVVGYSRMIRADEDGTLAALRAARAEIIDPTIAKHRGRTVKLMGDGILVEFASAVDAVATAVAVQQAMSRWNDGRPEDRHITFRIGVNLGDVVIDGADIQGDGINLAARLEALAEPGAVCLSDAVHDQVRDRLDLTFTDRGPQDLKNIDRPVQIWQWSNGSLAPKPLPEDVRLELPKKPSIAVLPFENLSADPEQDFFADGISEDIITALSRNRELFVIARNSSFSFRGKAMDIRVVGKDLGVRFVLEGSVRRAGSRVRITAQLVEAETGSQIWAERYDRPVTDIFEVQDEITMNVAGAVGSEIRAADVRSVARRDIKDLRSWERLMKAYWHINRINPEDNLKGQEICRAEIEATGGSAQIYSALMLGCAFEFNFWLGNRPPTEAIREGMQAAHAAFELDPNDDSAHAILCLFLFVCGEHDASLREGKAALDLNPNVVFAHMAMGGTLAYSGADFYDRAMEHLDKAVRLGPRDLSITWTYGHMARAALQAGRLTEAIDYARAAIRNDPASGTAHRLLSASLALDGQIEAAQKAWAATCGVSPTDMDAWADMARRVHRRPEDFETLKRGLMLAGAPFKN